MNWRAPCATSSHPALTVTQIGRPEPLLTAPLIKAEAARRGFSNNQNPSALAEARLKISREAPAAEPHAASRTLVSKDSLTGSDETGAYRPHPTQSNSRSVRAR